MTIVRPQPDHSRQSQARIAVVHDWLLFRRGGEKVLEAILSVCPQAEVFTLIHSPGASGSSIDERRITASWLSALPGVRHYHRLLLPFFPRAITRLEIRDRDIVISSSHSFAKAVTVKDGARHLCYCHTPIRYVSGQEDHYFGKGVKRIFAAPWIAYLRWWDKKTSGDGIHRILCNSNYVRTRIANAWGRDADVLYPGVDLDFFTLSDRPREDFYLLVGGFVPYKKEELVVEAFNRLGLPLVVVGDGPSRRSAERLSLSNIRFRGHVSDEELRDLYSRCAALVYPQEEDFGMVAVEAQATGAPVIAFAAGGALETVISAADLGSGMCTGILFERQTADALVKAVETFAANRTAFRPEVSRINAERFSLANFRKGLAAEIEKLLNRTLGADKKFDRASIASDESALD